MRVTCPGRLAAVSAVVGATVALGLAGTAVAGTGSGCTDDRYRDAPAVFDRGSPGVARLEANADGRGCEARPTHGAGSDNGSADSRGAGPAPVGKTPERPVR